MIIALTGTNSFALKQRLEELVSNFVAEHGELALEKIDAEAASENQILDAVQSLPFLASRKMVVLREPSASKEIQDRVEQIISSTTETTDLIIHEPAPDKRTAYFKVLKSNTKLEEFGPLDSRNLAGWLVDEAKNQGGELSFQDANYMVERLGTDQQMLANELGKLLVYEPKISRATIDLLTEPAPQSNVFNLLDAAFSGNKKRALKLYEEQRAQKVEPQLIIGMIAWQLQLMALAKNAGRRTPAQIAADSGMKSYPIEKARTLAGRLSGDELNNLVSEALDIDYKSKTTALDLDEALKNYIVATL